MSNTNKSVKPDKQHKYDTIMVKDLVNYGFGTYDELVDKINASEQTIKFWDINEVVNKVFYQNEKISILH